MVPVAAVEPVVTSCIDPIATVRVTVWPRSSESVSVPDGLLITTTGSAPKLVVVV